MTDEILPPPRRGQDDPGICRGQLVVMQGEGQGREFSFSQRLTIGREEDNNVVLKEDIVSRRHAEIKFVDNRYKVYDLKSHNGIKLNGLKIDEADLKHGDLLQVGASTFQFKLSPVDETMMMEKPCAISKPEVISILRKFPVKTLLLVGGGILLVIAIAALRSPVRQLPLKERVSVSDQKKEKLERVKKLAEFASVEDLLQEAEKKYAAGEQLYEEREITQGNLYNAAGYFKETIILTEDLTPQPPLYVKAKEKLTLCGEDLNKQFIDLRFMLEKYIRLKEWTRAMQSAETIMSMFPDPVDERYKYARQHYLRLKKMLHK